MFLGFPQFLAPVQLRLLKFRFPKILEVVSRPEFAQDHESGLRFDRGPVVLFDFSKLRSCKSPYSSYLINATRDRKIKNKNKFLRTDPENGRK